MKITSKYTATLIVTVLLLMMSTSVSFTQTVTKNTVQSFLKGLTKRAEKIITNTANTQEITQTSVLKVGTYFFKTVSNVQVALHTELEIPLELATEDTKDILTKLEQIVTNLSIGTSELVLLNNLKGIDNQLTFNKHLPQVNEITPVFFMKNEALNITLKGYFPVAEEEGFFRPYGLIEEESTTTGTDNRVIKNTKKTTIIAGINEPQKLTFSIPREYMPSYRENAKYVMIDFFVPYIQKTEDTESRGEAKYTCMFAVLPTTIGQLTLTSKEVQQVVGKKTKRTKTFIQHTTNRDITENYCIKDREPIVPGSTKLVIEWSQGRKDIDWSYYKRKGGCYTVETVYTYGGKSGKLNFHIQYAVKKTSKNVKRNAESRDVHWGDRQIFTVNPKNWELTFEAYDGTKLTLNEVKDTPFLQLSLVGNQMEIKTPTIQDFFYKN